MEPTPLSPIQWQSLVQWVPGETRRSSEGLGWNGLGLRSYRYEGQYVEVPEMLDYLFVSNDGGAFPLRRSFGGAWKTALLERGSTSLLSRKQTSRWDWNQTAFVTHLYLSKPLVDAVACEVLDGRSGEAVLNDILCTNDPLVRATIVSLTREVASGGIGGSLYADELARSLILHLLRGFNPRTPAQAVAQGELSAPMRRHLCDYIEEHLADTITLDDLAVEVGLPPWAFTRRFKASFGLPPYGYVQRLRVERAGRLLTESALSISEIAALCGFSDQSHLTRLFRRRFGMPPGKFRRHAHT
ncbi:MAG: AraC family transcriptional regulator [Pseudomonadota bacterium]